MIFSTPKPSLFNRSRKLENKIDDFLDQISKAGLIFNKTMEIYLKSGVNEEFEELTERISNIEGRADRLRREIEQSLYGRNLIPDLRGDVLSLVENLDKLLNSYEANGYRFSIEIPEFPEDCHEDFLELIKTVNDCVEEVLSTSRAFFRDMNIVRDHIHKVAHFETEADRISSKLKKKVFSSSLPLANKMHIGHFVDITDDIANLAEDIADELAIYVIKRKI